jgi:hypothetical protein
VAPWPAPKDVLPGSSACRQRDQVSVY